MNILKNVPGSNANYIVVVSPLRIEPYNPNYIYNPYIHIADNGRMSLLT
jgi:hypothetical protein